MYSTLSITKSTFSGLSLRLEELSRGDYKNNETKEQFPDKYLSDEIGYFKDELKGNVIQEAYFLGPKQYRWY